MGSPDHHFDIVCYLDCIEFAMEKCRVLNKRSASTLDPRRIEERLKYCLTVMHSFGLIHKDIKPQNILLDELDTPVLADFGISTAVSVRPGSKSLTYR